MKHILQATAGHLWRKKYSVALLCLITGLFIFWYYFHVGQLLLPGLYAGTMPIGGMSAKEASKKLSTATDQFLKQGITLSIGNQQQTIKPEEFELVFDIQETITKAQWLSKNPLQGIINILQNKNRTIPISYTCNEALLASHLGAISEQTNTKKNDLRLSISKGTVTLLTDTKSGYILNEKKTKEHILTAIADLRSAPVPAIRTMETPTILLASAERAKTQAEQILKDSIVLVYDENKYTITKERIGSWITTQGKDTELVVDIDEESVAAYLTTIAERINVPSVAPKIITDENNKVTSFTLPKPGIVLEEKKAIDKIISLLQSRRDGIQSDATTSTLALETIIGKTPEMSEDFIGFGIRELIGKATTSFVGSPTNRIANIKNGVKFLTGILIKPGEEFSTVGALGQIDNTTGYLPELVIRGDKTTPEFGGGLCQVSTTLFRAVMNAGLPITKRTNHSYRVVYYERDGEGKFIGPGLDATIYMPQPDFRFINDTPGNILINGYVKGTKVTFDLYGTKDGRVSFIDGPKLLSSTPPGDPIYKETDTLPVGEIKQTEKPHPGGSAIATYKVEKDGVIVFEKVFKSVYRPWPAQYLKGAPKQPDLIEPLIQATDTSSSTTPITTP